MVSILTTTTLAQRIWITRVDVDYIEGDYYKITVRVWAQKLLFDKDWRKVECSVEIRSSYPYMVSFRYKLTIRYVDGSMKIKEEPVLFVGPGCLVRSIRSWTWWSSPWVDWGKSEAWCGIEYAVAFVT